VVVWRWTRKAAGRQQKGSRKAAERQQRGVLPYRAADAPVVQLNHLGLLGDELVALDLVGVEVHLAHIVHDHGHAQPPRLGQGVILAQDALQQGRLAGAEEAREHADFHRRASGGHNLMRQYGM
jgi:hypothetical protein